MPISEGILINGVTEILKKVVPIIGQEINLACGVKDELEKLQETLKMILAVTADAERKQLNDAAVRLWLGRLKDVAYDVDDVMDEFSYEAMRRSVRGINLKYKVGDFVSSANPLAFRFKMAKKIKNINQRLDVINKDKSMFQLQITPAINSAIHPGESSVQRRRRTESFTDESYIIGREDAKEKIINMLTKVIPSSSSPTSNLEKVSTVSIVGMGGLGKTSLARLVYKDKFVNIHFELKLWVHVSQHFDAEKLLTKILESSTQIKFDALSNLDVLVGKVQEQLNGKRYLLVFDDFWNDKVEEWERLYTLLLVGAQGSRILITTRKTQVADVVKGSIRPYQLGKLPEDECWSIIEKRAFSPDGALKTANMMRIGREIAKKCGGLPLSAQFLGGQMRLNTEEVDWLGILKNDIWKLPESESTIMQILKLSYDNLSSELKQCFSYCSIFPKDWEINRVTLVQLWIAEGFLDTCKVADGRSIEDIANDYFENLVWSSFFDGVKKSLLDDIETCKMHDLVHDLAKAVAGDQEYASLKVCELKNTSRIRRLQLILDDDVDMSSKLLESFSDAKKLRTLFIPGGSKLDPCIFSRINRLRILHLSHSPDHTDPAPKWRSLSVLKHLRYLRLTCHDLREVKTDLSIGKLYNLETMVLSCLDVGVQILLTSIRSLRKLRYLEVSHTDMVELPDSVTSLCNLQSLNLNNCKLKVIPESISGLKNLRFLNLSFNPIEELPLSVCTISNLETLDVSSCENLEAFPESVAGLAKLRIFNFQDCPLLKALPKDFGTLTQLRYLNLVGTGIKILPESCVNLRNIVYMDLWDCELPNDANNWIQLRKFLCRQPKKPVLGIGKLVCLRELVYSVPEKQENEAEYNFGIEELEHLTFLEKLSIWNLENVKDPIDAERVNLKGKQNLRALVLHWDKNSCNFPVFEALQPPTCLRQLSIYNFMGCHLPMWMFVQSYLPNLDTLVIYGCSKIIQLPAVIGKLPRLKSLVLQGMSLKSLDFEGFPSLINLFLTDMFLLEELGSSNPCLQHLHIIGCKSLTEIPLFPSLMRLTLQKIDHKLVCSVGRNQTSLEGLWLENIEELLYFPISIFQNNCNLQILRIKECNQFEGFGVYDDENRTCAALYGPEIYSRSLQQLCLINCDVLKFLPKLQGWTSLQKLIIFKCPQVKESLNYDLKSISSLQVLGVDFIQRDEKRGDPSKIEELVNLMDK